MPFGLMHAPSHFQKMMHQIFRSLPFVRLYLKNIATFSRTLDEHSLQVPKILEIIYQDGLKHKIKYAAPPRDALLYSNELSTRKV